MPCSKAPRVLATRRVYTKSWCPTPIIIENDAGRKSTMVDITIDGRGVLSRPSQLDVEGQSWGTLCPTRGQSKFQPTVNTNIEPFLATKPQLLRHVEKLTTRN